MHDRNIIGIASIAINLVAMLGNIVVTVSLGDPALIYRSTPYIYRFIRLGSDAVVTIDSKVLLVNIVLIVLGMFLAVGGLVTEKKEKVIPILALILCIANLCFYLMVAVGFLWLYDGLGIIDNFTMAALSS